MTRPAPYEGRHRATTVPSRWDHPGDRRHLTRLPGFDWATAEGIPERGPFEPVSPGPAFPPPGERDPDVTQDIPMPPGTLPPALVGPDPEPTGPLPCWATGPIVLPPPRNDAPPSMGWAWFGAFWLVAIVTFALFRISFGGG